MHKLEYATPARREKRLLADVFAAAVSVAYLVGFPVFLIVAAVAAVASVALAAVGAVCAGKQRRVG
jgi:hypothetical protein